MKYFLCLLLAISSACDGVGRETGCERNTASTEASVSVLTIHEDAHELRLHMTKEQYRKGNCEPLWDTATHDEIYELWHESAWSLAREVTIDRDDLLGLRFSQRRIFDEKSTNLSQLVQENRLDFASALDGWPHFKATAMRFLDAKERQEKMKYAARFEANDRARKRAIRGIGGRTQDEGSLSDSGTVQRNVRVNLAKYDAGLKEVLNLSNEHRRVVKAIAATRTRLDTLDLLFDRRK